MAERFVPAQVPPEGALGRATDEDAERARRELAIEAAGVGGFDWDLETGRLRWDARLLEMFGYAEQDFAETIEAFNARVHPDDVTQVGNVIENAIARCGDFETEYRVVRPDGATRWIEARGRVLGDEQGRAVRLLGAAFDTTAVHEGEARVARVLESMSAAFFLLDRRWRFTYVNREAERLLARTRDEMLGGDLWELFPASVGSDFEVHYRRAMESGEAETFEAHYPAPLDAWYEVRALPVPDGLSVYFLDVTVRHHADQARRDATARAALLASVTADLTDTLDPDEAAARLARLVVPALGDWCIVSLLDEDRPGADWDRLRDSGWWHVDPERRALIERYARVRLAALGSESFLARSLATGAPVVVEAQDATAAVAAVLAPGEARKLLLLLQPESFVVVPMRARGRILGLLTVCRDTGHGGMPDVAACVEVTERAALALDNVRLYEQQRRMAERLQRSLLTAPPEPDHLEVVVRYEPAAEAAQVGGDWYDAFLQPQGQTVLVIGDVVGHDAVAAAAMGQVRGLLRGIAATTGDGPATVLSRLDRAMELLQVETTATAVVARLEQTAEERARGITRLRWSNAGHPPPVSVDEQGRVAVLGRSGDATADLLLGIDSSVERTESEVTLDRGATVLLYTDGLVERRDQSVDDGIARLVAVLGECAGLDLDSLCDRVLERLLPAVREDDVALTVVRLHPQDAPRPSGAGPNRVPPTVGED